MNTTTTHKLLDGRAIAGEIRAGVANDVAQLKAEGWPVHLVSISVGDTEAARLYVRNQQRAAEKVGMDFEARDYLPISGPRSCWASCMASTSTRALAGSSSSDPCPIIFRRASSSAGFTR